MVTDVRQIVISLFLPVHCRDLRLVLSLCFHSEKGTNEQVGTEGIWWGVKERISFYLRPHTIIFFSRVGRLSFYV